MIYIFFTLSLLMTFVICYLINKKIVFNCKYKQVIICILILISLLSVAVMMWMYYSRDVVYILKRLILIAVLWPIAISDYKEFRIPNKMILFGIVSRILLIIVEMIYKNDELSQMLLSEGIAIIGSVVVCLMCMTLIKGGLGMGDLKLMIVMGAFLGIEGICYSMFVSVFLAFIVAVCLLISKKRKREDSMPFAPFILAGTIISSIISGI